RLLIAVSQAEQNDRPNQQGDRTLVKDRQIASTHEKAFAEVLFNGRAEDKAHHERSQLEVQFSQDEADQADEPKEVHVGHAVVDAVRSDGRQHEDDSQKNVHGRAEKIDPQPDQGNVQHQKDQVADKHRGDHAPKDLRVKGHQEGSRLNAV